MSYCQCEHSKHLIETPDHWAEPKPTVPVKTIYGTFQLCKECEANCYPEEYRA